MLTTLSDRGDRSNNAVDPAAPERPHIHGVVATLRGTILKLRSCIPLGSWDASARSMCVFVGRHCCLSPRDGGLASRRCHQGHAGKTPLHAQPVTRNQHCRALVKLGVASRRAPLSCGKNRSLTRVLHRPVCNTGSYSLSTLSGAHGGPTALRAKGLPGEAAPRPNNAPLDCDGERRSAGEAAPRPNNAPLRLALLKLTRFKRACSRRTRGQLAEVGIVVLPKSRGDRLLDHSACAVRHQTFVGAASGERHQSPLWAQRPRISSPVPSVDSVCPRCHGGAAVDGCPPLSGR